MVMGWAIWPADYVFNIENSLGKEVLDVHCASNTKDESDLGLVHVPLHKNYAHKFKSGVWDTVTYTCTLTIPGGAFKVFEVYIDAQKFIDDQCGGRHCFWKVQEDGIYLYQIHKDKYFKKYNWDHADS